MKKKIVGLLLTTIMAASFVGCSSASIFTSSTKDEIDYTYRECVEITRFYSNYNSDYYVECLSVNYAPKYEYLENEIRAIYNSSEEIQLELFGKDEVYTEPTRVLLTGEIKDGKTYFYYDGYVTTLDGVTQDYNKVITLDYELDPEIYNFTLDD